MKETIIIKKQEKKGMQKIFPLLVVMILGVIIVSLPVVSAAWYSPITDFFKKIFSIGKPDFQGDSELGSFGAFGSNDEGSDDNGDPPIKPSPKCYVDKQCGDPYNFFKACVGDTLTSGNITPTCFNGGTSLAQCVNVSKSSIIEECEYGCYAGACLPTETCVPDCFIQGEKKCDGSRAKTCLDHNLDKCLEWGEGIYCQYGCSSGTCNPTGACVNDCTTSGQKRCSNNFAQICNDSNKDGCLEWNTGTDCGVYGCNTTTGICRPCMSVCNNGDKNCSGNKYQICGDWNYNTCYEWKTERNCLNGCNAATGVCNPDLCTNDIGCTVEGGFCEEINQTIIPYNCTLGIDGCLDKIQDTRSGCNYGCLNGICIDHYPPADYITNCTNDLILNLKFDNSLLDSSIYGNWVNKFGGKYSSIGISNQSYEFNGINNYLSINNQKCINFTTNDFSYCAWIKLKAEPITKGYYILSKKIPLGYNFWINPNALLQASLNKGYNVFNFGSTMLNDTLWHYVCAVYDRDAGLSMYVDGIQEREAANISFASASIDNSGALLIGKNEAENYFKGLMDELVVYRRALNSSEILQGFQNPEYLAGKTCTDKCTKGKCHRVRIDDGNNQGEDPEHHIGHYWHTDWYGIEPCTDSDNDGCLELGDATNCSEGCSDGTCAHTSDCTIPLVLQLGFEAEGEKTYQNEVKKYIGELEDISQYENNITSFGGTYTDGVMKLLSLGYSFDGIDDYLVIKNSKCLDFTTNDFSYCAWIKIPTGPMENSLPILSKKPSTGYNFFINPGGRVQASLNDGDNAFNFGNRQLNNSYWRHVCAVYDRDAGLSIYLDGKLERENSNISLAMGSIANSGDFYIGRNEAGNYFKGVMDDVMIYRKALTSEEINKDSSETNEFLYEKYYLPDGGRCTPKTCEELRGKICGNWSDGCGGIVNCGKDCSEYPAPSGSNDYCYDHDDCNITKVCNSTGMCVEQDCYNPQCPKAYKCIEQIIDLNLTDRNSIRKICVRDYCYSITDCEKGYTCRDNTCTYSSCKNNSDCEDGYACSMDNLCLKVDCVLDTDCTPFSEAYNGLSNYVSCRNNLCQYNFCFTNETCGSGYYCDVDYMCKPKECVKKTCEELGKQCGSWYANCGETIWCNSCSEDNVCDNGQCVPDKCTLTGAKWQVDLFKPKTVNMIVEGTNCEGKEINFSVYEDDGILGKDPVLVNTGPNTDTNNNNPGITGNAVSEGDLGGLIAQINNGIAQFQWVMENFFEEDDGLLGRDPEYVFTATVLDNENPSSIDSETQLTKSYFNMPLFAPSSYYAFDSDAKDSVSGNDGEVVGAELAWGVACGGYKFDGGSYIALPNNYQSTEIEKISSCFWIKTEIFGPMPIVDFDQTNYFGISVNMGRILWTTTSYNGPDAGSSPDPLGGNKRVDDNKWHHVCVSYGPKGKTIYIDGELDATTKINGKLGTGIRRYGFVGVPSQADSFYGEHGETYFNGSIDELMIFNDTELTLGAVSYYQVNFLNENKGKACLQPFYVVSTKPGTPLKEDPASTSEMFSTPGKIEFSHPIDASMLASNITIRIGKGCVNSPELGTLMEDYPLTFDENNPDEITFMLRNDVVPIKRWDKFNKEEMKGKIYFDYLYKPNFDNFISARVKEGYYTWEQAQLYWGEEFTPETWSKGSGDYGSGDYMITITVSGGEKGIKSTSGNTLKGNNYSKFFNSWDSNGDRVIDYEEKNSNKFLQREGDFNISFACVPRRTACGVPNPPMPTGLLASATQKDNTIQIPKGYLDAGYYLDYGQYNTCMDFWVPEQSNTYGDYFERPREQRYEYIIPITPKFCKKIEDLFIKNNPAYRYPLVNCNPRDPEYAKCMLKNPLVGDVTTKPVENRVCCNWPGEVSKGWDTTKTYAPYQPPSRQDMYCEAKPNGEIGYFNDRFCSTDHSRIIQNYNGGEQAGYAQIQQFDYTLRDWWFDAGSLDVGIGTIGRRGGGVFGSGFPPSCMNSIGYIGSGCHGFVYGTAPAAFVCCTNGYEDLDYALRGLVATGNSKPYVHPVIKPVGKNDGSSCLQYTSGKIPAGTLDYLEQTCGSKTDFFAVSESYEQAQDFKARWKFCKEKGYQWEGDIGCVMQYADYIKNDPAPIADRKFYNYYRFSDNALSRNIWLESISDMPYSEMFQDYRNVSFTTKATCCSYNQWFNAIRDFGKEDDGRSGLKYNAFFIAKRNIKTDIPYVKLSERPIKIEGQNKEYLYLNPSDQLGISFDVPLDDGCESKFTLDKSNNIAGAVSSGKEKNFTYVIKRGASPTQFSGKATAKCKRSTTTDFCRYFFDNVKMNEIMDSLSKGTNSQDLIIEIVAADDLGVENTYKSKSTNILRNKKNEAKFNESGLRQMFLISDRSGSNSEWARIFRTIPAVMWQDSEKQDKWCNKIDGTDQGDYSKCSYPLLIYHEENGLLDPDSIEYGKGAYASYQPNPETLDNSLKSTVYKSIEDYGPGLLVFIDATPSVKNAYTTAYPNIPIKEISETGLLGLWEEAGLFVLTDKSDYASLILATQLATYLNAPLIYMQDNLENIKGKFIIYVGANRSLDSLKNNNNILLTYKDSLYYDAEDNKKGKFSTFTDQTLGEYFKNMFPTALIAVNPNDLNDANCQSKRIGGTQDNPDSGILFQKLYCKMSLNAPIMAFGNDMYIGMVGKNLAPIYQGHLYFEDMENQIEDANLLLDSIFSLDEWTQQDINDIDNLMNLINESENNIKIYQDSLKERAELLKVDFDKITNPNLQQMIIMADPTSVPEGYTDLFDTTCNQDALPKTYSNSLRMLYADQPEAQKIPNYFPEDVYGTTPASVAAALTGSLQNIDPCAQTGLGDSKDYNKIKPEIRYMVEMLLENENPGFRLLPLLLDPNVAGFDTDTAIVANKKALTNYFDGKLENFEEFLATNHPTELYASTNNYENTKFSCQLNKGILELPKFRGYQGYLVSDKTNLGTAQITLDEKQKILAIGYYYAIMNRFKSGILNGLEGMQTIGKLNPTTTLSPRDQYISIIEGIKSDTKVSAEKETKISSLLPQIDERFAAFYEQAGEYDPDKNLEFKQSLVDSTNESMIYIKGLSYNYVQARKAKQDCHSPSPDGPVSGDEYCQLKYNLFCDECEEKYAEDMRIADATIKTVVGMYPWLNSEAYRNYCGDPLSHASLVFTSAAYNKDEDPENGLCDIDQLTVFDIMLKSQREALKEYIKTAKEAIYCMHSEGYNSEIVDGVTSGPYTGCKGKVDKALKMSPPMTLFNAIPLNNVSSNETKLEARKISVVNGWLGAANDGIEYLELKGQSNKLIRDFWINTGLTVATAGFGTSAAETKAAFAALKTGSGVVNTVDKTGKTIQVAFGAKHALGLAAVGIDASWASYGVADAISICDESLGEMDGPVFSQSNELPEKQIIGLKSTVPKINLGPNVVSNYKNCVMAAVGAATNFVSFAPIFVKPRIPKGAQEILDKAKGVDDFSVPTEYSRIRKPQLARIAIDGPILIKSQKSLMSLDKASPNYEQAYKQAYQQILFDSEEYLKKIKSEIDPGLTWKISGDKDIEKVIVITNIGNKNTDMGKVFAKLQKDTSDTVNHGKIVLDPKNSITEAAIWEGDMLLSPAIIGMWERFDPLIKKVIVRHEFVHGGHFKLRTISGDELSDLVYYRNTDGSIITLEAYAESGLYPDEFSAYHVNHMYQAGELSKLKRELLNPESAPRRLVQDMKDKGLDPIDQLLIELKSSKIRAEAVDTLAKKELTIMDTISTDLDRLTLIEAQYGKNALTFKSPNKLIAFEPFTDPITNEKWVNVIVGEFKMNLVGEEDFVHSAEILIKNEEVWSSTKSMIDSGSINPTQANNIFSSLVLDPNSIVKSQLNKNIVRAQEEIKKIKNMEDLANNLYNRIRVTATLDVSTNVQIAPFEHRLQTAQEITDLRNMIAGAIKDDRKFLLSETGNAFEVGFLQTSSPIKTLTTAGVCPAPLQQQLPQSSPQAKSNQLPLIWIIAILATIVLLLSITQFIVLRKRNKKHPRNRK